MCVWLRYNHLNELPIRVENGLVVEANGDKLKKSHPYDEFMKLAEDNSWQPQPQPVKPDGKVTLPKANTQ